MTGYHDQNSRVAGSWTIIECVSLSGSTEAAGIEGTEFILSETGDVEWNIKGNQNHLPLFECRMFEVYTYQNLQCYVKRTLLRFAAYKGHIIEFRLDQPVMSEDLMLLTYDGWFMLQCERSPVSAHVQERNFSLLAALEDEYFADLSITSQSGRKYPCHSIVLQAVIPNINWKSFCKKSPSLLCGLDDEVTKILLHYLYTLSLPNEVSFCTAKLCIASTENIPDLNDFREKCHIYARNTYFRNKILRIVHEIHDCLKTLARILLSSHEFVSKPSEIVRRLKEGLTPFATGLIKVLEICQEFEIMSNWLNSREQKEVIKYIRSQAPAVLQEVTDILKHAHGILTAFTTQSRLEFAQLIVPEIQNALHLIVCDGAALRNCLEQIIQISTLSACSSTKDSSLVKSLENDLQLRELQKLRILQENLSSMTNSLLTRKIQFEEFESSSRNRGVSRMLELLTFELSELIQRLNEFASAVDDIFDWSEFKFVFKGGTSKLHRIMEKLASHSDIVEVFIQELVDRVNTPSFTSTVENLGFVTSRVHCHFETKSSQYQPQKFFTEKQPSVNTNVPYQSIIEDTSNILFDLTGNTSIAPEVCNSECESKVESYGFSDIPLNDSSPVKVGSVKNINCLCEEIGEKGVLDSFSKLPLRISLPPKVDPKLKVFSDLKPNNINLDDLYEDMELPQYLQHEADKINLVQHVCEIPSAGKSKLANALLMMLESETLVDLTFCIIPPKDNDEYSNSSQESELCATDNYKAGNSLICREPCFLICDHSRDSNCSAKNVLLESNDTTTSYNILKLENLKGCNDDDRAGHMKRYSQEIFSDKIDINSSDMTPIDSASIAQLETKAVFDDFDNIMQAFSSSRHIARKLKKSFSLDQNPNILTQQRCPKQNPVSLKNDNDNNDLPHYEKASGIFTQSLSLDLQSLMPVSTVSVNSLSVCSLSSNPSIEDIIGQCNELSINGHEPASIFSSQSEISNNCANYSDTTAKECHPKVELRAHRVVIGTQCEWFKKALLSGMKEAIDRYIEVPGCSVHIFKMFLRYLYTGEFDVASLMTDELVDFLVLVDHYGVDSLKSLLEQHLESRVDDDTAVPLLMVAYHCNITKLKDLCLNHCALKRRYDILNQVPSDLRQQFVGAINNLRKWNQIEIDNETFDSMLGSQFRMDEGPYTCLDPLIDEELSSLLYNMQDSSSSSEDGYSFPSNNR